jgi:hypothetical protein
MEALGTVGAAMEALGTVGAVVDAPDKAQANRSPSMMTRPSFSL